MGFVFKFSLFILVGIISLFLQNVAVNLGLAVFFFILIFVTGFGRENRKIIYLIGYSIIFFSFFWVVLSRVPGDVTYLVWPWKTFVSDRTFDLLAIAICKWLSIASAGILFLVVSSENELINSLEYFNLPEKAIYTATIAFNTVGFTLKDISVVENALTARSYSNRGISGKIKKIYFIGGVVLLNNLKKIGTLYQSYVLRSGDD